MRNPGHVAAHDASFYHETESSNLQADTNLKYPMSVLSLNILAQKTKAKFPLLSMTEGVMNNLEGLSPG